MKVRKPHLQHQSRHSVLTLRMHAASDKSANGAFASTYAAALAQSSSDKVNAAAQAIAQAASRKRPDLHMHVISHVKAAVVWSFAKLA